MPPSERDLNTTDLALRTASPERYLRADGDFDGDGLQDRAVLMVRRESNDAGVVLYRDGKEPLVVRTFPLRQVAAVGIETVRPGSYQPACARGAGVDCPSGTRISIPHDAISVFTFESGAVYVWFEGERVMTMTASD